MAIRQHYTRGEVGTLKTEQRKRDIPLPQLLVGALLSLKLLVNHGLDERGVRLPHGAACQRKQYPQAAVRQDSHGPRPTAPRLAFIQVHAHHPNPVDWMHSRDRQALMGHGALEQTQSYTQVDYERMRQGLDQIAGMIMQTPEILQ